MSIFARFLPFIRTRVPQSIAQICPNGGARFMEGRSDVILFYRFRIRHLFPSGFQQTKVAWQLLRV